MSTIAETTPFILRTCYTIRETRFIFHFIGAHLSCKIYAIAGVLPVCKDVCQHQFATLGYTCYKKSKYVTIENIKGVYCITKDSVSAIEAYILRSM